MANFSSFFPAAGGGGGVIVNDFQTGSSAIDFNQLQAYSIASQDISNTTIGSPSFGTGNISSSIPLGSFNTFATVADVTNSNGGAFCYATLQDTNHSDYTFTSARNNLGGNTIFKITLDGTAHLVHYKPTLGAANGINSISVLGFPEMIRGSSFRVLGNKYSISGQQDNGTFWDAVTSTTQTTFNRSNFGGSAGDTETYNLTTAVPSSGTSYDLDSDGFPILISGTGSFQGNTAGNQAGVLINSKEYSVTVVSMTQGGSIKITVTGAATVNSDGSLTIPMQSTRLEGDNNRFTGKMNFQSSESFSQQTVRSARINSYSTSDAIHSNFLTPKTHLTLGLPWVKFESTCKVEMSHESEGEGDGNTRNPTRTTNVGIYEF